MNTVQHESENSDIALPYSKTRLPALSRSALGRVFDEIANYGRQILERQKELAQKRPNQ